jgi:pimeloyl-ACP methyl ester carboxylesterase
MQVQVNDAPVYLYTGGIEFDAGKPSLVFLHGAGMDHTAWTLYVRYFARAGFNALAVDLPGNGRSGGTPLASIEALADWLAALLDALGIARATLIGHSMGSLLALEAAARWPDRVEKLVLLGTAFPMPVGEPLLDAARDNRHSAVDMVALFGHGYRAQLGGTPLAGVSVLNSGVRLLEQAGPGVLFAGLSACNDYQNGWQAAESLRCPVALIVGDSDLMTPPRAARALADAMPNARIIALENCGHMMMSEQPEALHRVLRKVLIG